MPYPTLDSLPDAVKKLPKHAQEIFQSAYNSAFAQYDGDESKSAATAWAAVKKAGYGKNDTGDWVKLVELETVDLAGVEILAVGTWSGSTGATKITKEDLKGLAESFDSITEGGKTNYEPPLKLGHADKQKLLQDDGYPAAGWVSGLKVQGNKLVASIKGIPARLADLVKAGAYKKISAEFYRDYSIGGKEYPIVLKAVALLGGDIPAVKTIADIQALYAENDDLAQIVVFEESLDTKVNAVRNAFYALQKPAMPPAMYPATDMYIREIFDTHVICDGSEGMYQMPYTVDGQGAVVFDIAQAQKVEIVYQPITAPEGMAEWDTTYVSDLPDSAFALIKSGGEKDEDGKTVPRALRMLPYKNAAGAVDLPHLRNALARLSQTDLTVTERASARKVLEAAAEKAKVGERTNETEVHMDKELRTLLGLDERADIIATVTALKAQAGSQTISLAEQEEVKSKVKALETKLAERERDERVTKAISSGKLIPAQKVWADKYALSDPAGFDTYIASALQVVPLGESGSAGGKPEETQLTEMEIRVSGIMGVSREDLLKAKKQGVTK